MTIQIIVFGVGKKKGGMMELSSDKVTLVKFLLTEKEAHALAQELDKVLNTKRPTEPNLMLSEMFSLLDNRFL